jgi:hypothetical protein
MKRICLFIGMAMLVALHLHGQSKQAPERWIGTWKLSAEKSKFVRGALQSRTLRFENAAAGLKVTSDLVNQQGVPQHQEYILTYDGKEASMGLVGAGPQTGIFKRIDASTFEVTTKTNGAVVITDRYSIASNGKTMTSSRLMFMVNPDMTSNPDPSGPSSLVYERQP